MPQNDETIRALRDALTVSPDNMALRRHLAELLISAGKLSEAVDEYRHALGISPRDDSLRLPLARLYMDLGNDSAALVIVEEVLKQRSPPAAAYQVYAQLLLNTNQPDRRRTPTAKPSRRIRRSPTPTWPASWASIPKRESRPKRRNSTMTTAASACPRMKAAKLTSPPSWSVPKSPLPTSAAWNR